MLLDPFVLDSELASQTVDGDPATLALGSITVEQIWKEMKIMPPAQYRVAYLDWACGWRTSEIASALGIAESTVRVHRRNAVQALRGLVVPLIAYDVDEADDDRIERYLTEVDAVFDVEAGLRRLRLRMAEPTESRKEASGAATAETTNVVSDLR
ncbi:MAG: LuxR C-terminal-related transcriptional regulator [Pseudonocardiaceae bacterium]